MSSNCSFRRTDTDENGVRYETRMDWDVEWYCWRQLVIRTDIDGERSVISDEYIADEISAIKGGKPGYHAKQEMDQIAAAARRDDRRADRKAKAEYYAELEDGGMF